MNAINLTDGDITHRKEVIPLLKVAISQKWAFSYLRTQGKKITSQALELVGVKSYEGVLRSAMSLAFLRWRKVIH